MSSKKLCGIYSLLCPSTNEVRYIGQSINIMQRYLGHVHTKSKGNKSSGIVAWCSSLKKQGLRPKLRVIEICIKSQLDKKEIAYIKEARESGLDLLNMHKGGKIDFKYIKSKSIWGIDGFSDPYLIFIRQVFSLRNNDAVGKKIKGISREYKACKTEEEKLNFQMNCAQWVVNHCEKPVAVKMERYLMEASVKINAKYNGRVTLVYSDSVEETP